MLIAILIIVISLISVSVIWLLTTAGLFEQISIRITKPPFNQLTIAYKFQRGAYSKSADIFKEINRYSKSLDKLGIYYDDPKIVSAENLRFAVGAIVDEIKDQELIKQMQKDNYKIFKLPPMSQSIYTTFPFTSDFSILIAIMKVPYQIGDYIRKNKLEAHPFLEIYKRPLIHYIVPLSDFDAYSVPEINNNS